MTFIRIPSVRSTQTISTGEDRGELKGRVRAAGHVKETASSLVRLTGPRRRQKELDGDGEQTVWTPGYLAAGLDFTLEIMELPPKL